MNKKRQKLLNDAYKKLDEIKTEFEELLGKIDDVKPILEQVRDEEQEAFDNLSEKQQEGEKGDTLHQNVEWLESAIEDLETFADVGFEQLLENIDNAQATA